MEPTQGSNSKGMNKENVVRIHTMEFLSAIRKNGVVLLARKWV